MKYSLALLAAVAAPILVANTSQAQPQRAQAQAQRQEAEARVKAARTELDQAQDAVNDAVKMAQEVYSVVTTDGALGNTAGRTLIIPKDGAEPKDLANLEEDMKIMAHILHKAAHGSTDKSRSAMGIAIRSQMFGEGAAPQNLFLEGYGAIFFLNVNYPLVAPAAKKAEAEPKEETSSEWDEARRELSMESAPPGFNFNFPHVMSFSGQPEEAYDADKVENLKTELITELKNASHIKKLKPDETVTIVVNGRGGRGEARVMSRRMGSGGTGGGGGASAGVGGGYGGGSQGAVTWAPRRSSAGQGSQLILRAKKADIDAFQKEKLSLDDFRNKVTLITH